MRFFATLLVATLGLTGSACDFTSEGDYDGVRFSPGATVFAVHDRHAFLTAGGETQAVRKPDAELGLTLVFTDVNLNPSEEWRRLRASRLLEIKKELAVRDGLLIENIPLSEISVGDDLEFTFNGPFRVGAPSGQDPLSRTQFSVVSALPAASVSADQGFGDALTVQLTFDAVDIRPSAGEVSGRIDIKRDRAEGQAGEVATGQVTLGFRAVIENERRGKANLAHLAPVLRCAAQRGPSRAGGCRDAAPEPIFDETSTLLPAAQ